LSTAAEVAAAIKVVFRQVASGELEAIEGAGAWRS
jgi:hypothetical protein